MRRRILYVSHTAAVSGGELSLLELLSALSNEVDATLASPVGELADRARGLGFRVAQVKATTGSLRLHPRHTPAAVRDLFLLAAQLRRLAGRTGADLVHANSIRAGLAAAACTRLGGPPSVVSVRDCLPSSRSTRLVARAIAANAAAVIGNSRYTSRCFGQVPSRSASIPSPIDLERFDPARVDREAARELIGLEPDQPALAVFAQITPWKGQDLAVRTLARLRAEWPRAVLLLVGEAKFTAPGTRYDNLAFLAALRREITALGVEDAVRFLGHRDDVPELIRASDVVLVPSWEEPFGRVVVESMAMGTPVVATSIGGPAEVVEDGRTGRLLAPRDDARWAKVVAEVLRDGVGRDAMTDAARCAALAYGSDAHARQVLEVYEAVLSEEDSAADMGSAIAAPSP